MLQFSWGPGTHIELADKLIDQSDVLPASHKALVDDFPEDFRYGCIAADLITFKAYGGLRNHCHNWNMQERLQAHATKPHQQAFIYGYLCHLAADVSAHNHFVPYHLLAGMPPVYFGHAYWELLADDHVDPIHWSAIDRLRQCPLLRENDEMVNRAVERKAISFRSNRWIFDNVILLRSKDRWQEKIAQLLKIQGHGVVSKPVLQNCLDLCFENMIKAASESGLKELAKHDANGWAALKSARLARKSLRQQYGKRRSAKSEATDRATQLFTQYGEIFGEGANGDAMHNRETGGGEIGGKA